MPDQPTCDLVVVGGGPAGCDAALDAAALGLDVLLVERDNLGGTCLNWGCIPTKLFLAATASLPALKAQQKFKIVEADLEAIRVSLSALQARKQKVLAGSRKGMAARLKQAGVRVLQGDAHFKAPGELRVEGETPAVVQYKDAIVATGAGSAAFPGMDLDDEIVLEARGVLDLQEVPESLLVVGGGAIGVEMGEIFRRLGARITIIEALDRLVPTEEPEIGQGLAKLLKREGWTIRTGVRVDSLAAEEGRAVCITSDGERLEASKALVAVGRAPHTADLGLEAVGCTLDRRGFVQVDETLRAAPHVYAVGDVNGRALLAHAASHQAAHVVHALAEGGAPYHGDPAPGCVYGSHEVMRAGHTVSEVLENYPDSVVETSTAQLAANPMAQAYAAGHGLVIAVWRDDQLAGVSALGHGVSHLVTIAEILCRDGARLESLSRYIVAHPSLDESLSEALRAPRTLRSA